METSASCKGTTKKVFLIIHMLQQMQERRRCGCENFGLLIADDTHVMAPVGSGGGAGASTTQAPDELVLSPAPRKSWLEVKLEFEEFLVLFAFSALLSRSYAAIARRRRVSAVEIPR